MPYMPKANALYIEEYASKVADQVLQNPDIPEWVEYKLSVIRTHLSDVKHFLDFYNSGYYSYSKDPDSKHTCKCKKISSSKTEEKIYTPTTLSGNLIRIMNNRAAGDYVI